MKTPIRKKDFKTFFINFGYLLLVFPILSLLLYYYPLNAVNAVRSDEQINIFLTAYSYNDDSLEKDLHTLLDEKGLYEVNVYYYRPDETYLTSYYEKFGKDSDFVFLYESDVKDMFKDELEGVTSSFLKWDQEIKNYAGCISDDTFYSLTDGDYALKVYDKENAGSFTHISELADFKTDKKNENVYLLLNSSRPNWGKYVSNSITENALIALKFLLERYR